MKQLALQALIGIMIVALVSSCAFMNASTTDKGAGIGAGAGAGVGAILGQLIGKDTKSTIAGAAIGSVVGALSGFLVAMNIDAKNKKLANAEQTRKSLAEAKRKGTTLVIDGKTIRPGQAMHPGDRAVVRVQYKILDGEKKMISYKEESSIWQHGKLIQDMGSETYTREAGTYENEIAFTLPDNIEKGPYEFRQRLSSGSVRRVASVPFHVL